MPTHRKRHRVTSILKKYQWIGFDTLLFCTGLFLLLVLRNQVWPAAMPVAYTFGSSEQTLQGTMPLVVSQAPATALHITVPMHMYRLHPRLFLVQADDCLVDLSINGQPVPREQWDNPKCDYNLKKRIAAGSFLHYGLNRVEATVSNAGGASSFRFEPDRLDPVMLGIEGAVLFLCIWYIVMWYRHAPLFWRKQAGFLWVAVGGIFLRLVYLVSTSASERGHDVDGHIEYVRYILAHWTIPQAGTGWQFYQPPLYYFLSAAWLSIRLPFGVLFGPSIDHLQLLAALLSCLTVLLLVSLSRTLFPKKTDTRFALLFLALTVCIPSLVFQASRINNDVLFAFLSILIFLQLVRWWKDPRPADWFALVILLGFAALTKSNASLLIAISFTCLFFGRIRLRQKTWMVLLSIVLLAAVMAWHIILRSKGVLQGNLLLVGNIQGLNGDLLLPVFSLRDSLLTFHPLAVMRQPFNNAFDMTLSRHFGEYFYRSMFFGEFDFGVRLKTLASVIIISGYTLVPFVFCGLYAMLRRKAMDTFPVWLTLGALLAAHILFRVIAPYSCSQDFRYSLLLIVPFAYCIVVGIRSLPRILRIAGYICSLFFIGVCSAFIIGIFVLPL